MTATERSGPSALISLRNCSVEFGGAPALRALNLTLYRGDRLSLVGPNGSGKTTLLRLLHGMVAASGERIVHAGGDDAATAMVFQRPYMLNLSAALNVTLGLWLHGAPRRERRFRCDEALQRVGLGAVARQRATTLSGGQQQRLAIARAWALKPALLILDEPTASLDPTSTREIEQLIGEIADSGVTVVMSSHNLGQVQRLATRVVYLEAGQLIEDRETRAFFTRPADPRTMQFLRAELPWEPGP